MEHGRFFVQKYKYLLIICFVFFLVLGIFFIVSRIGKRATTHTSSPVPQITSTAQETPTYSVPNTGNVWQISFSYNTKTQQLSMQKIQVQKGTANVSPNSTSPYKLLVLDKNQHVLFQTGITVAQQILYDIYFPPGSTPSALPQLETLDSLVTIPYFPDAEMIQVQKSGEVILSFAPPKQVSFFKLPSLIQQAYASTCDLLHVVFVSDGYTDMAKFHADVQRAEATYTSKAPFSNHTEIFDFKTVDNPSNSSLGCKANGSLNVYCIYTNANLSKISNTVFASYPQLPRDSTYTKIVVLVDGSPQPFAGGGLILGVANSVGGQFGVFQNQLFFESTATMEVLGHDVGQLYDRYIYPSQPGTASDMGNTIPAPYQSNCSTNSQGASFWKNAGVSTAYKGCTSQYMYAPEPLDCPNGAGSSKTLMSAAGCAGTQFDGVEQYYLESVILPRYCKFVPSPTPTPSPTSGPVHGSDVNPAMGSGNSNATITPGSSNGFKCVLDPQCANNKNNFQMCQLKCSPQ